MLMQFFFALIVLLNIEHANASTPTSIATLGTARDQQSSRLSPLSALSAGDTHRTTHRDTSPASAGSAAGTPSSLVQHPAPARARRPRNFRWTPNGIANSAATAAAVSGAAPHNHKTVLVVDEDSPPLCAAPQPLIVDDAAKRKSDSDTRPIIPALNLTVISPKGTARTVVEHTEKKEIKRLNREVRRLRKVELDLRQALHQSDGSTHLQPPSARRSRSSSSTQHHRATGPQELAHVSTARRMAYSPRKAGKTKSFCDKWGKTILCTSIVACAFFTGGFITASQTTNLSSPSASDLPIPSPGDFASLSAQLKDTQDALNTSLQTQDQLRSSITYLTTLVGLQSVSSQRTAQALSDCQHNLTQALGDGALYYNNWRGAAARNCTNGTELVPGNPGFNTTFYLDQLAALNDSLELCQGDSRMQLMMISNFSSQLAQTGSALALCSANNGACQVALIAAHANNSALQTDLATVRQDRDDCVTDETAWQTELATTQGQLTVCAANASACQLALTGANANATSLQSQLATCKAQREECISDEAACQTALQTTNNSWSVALAAAGGLQTQVNGLNNNLTLCMNDRDTLRANLTASQRALNQSQWQFVQCQSDLSQTQAQLSASQTCYNAAYGLLSGFLRLLLPPNC